MLPSPFAIATTDTLRQLAAQQPDNAHLAATLRHLAKWRADLIFRTLAVRSGTQVLSGPFHGMAYALRASEGSGAARLLGVYEASLTPIIELIIQRAYPTVVDIGCAEGYYAVGLARRMPGSRIIARDQSTKAQDLCRQLAALNGVADRVEIGGRMDHADFDLCTAQKTLILCDIEGGEADFLDPTAAPGLIRADILVECHDVVRADLTDLLTRRFLPTHHVARIDRQLTATLPDWMEELSDLDRLRIWANRRGNILNSI